MKKMYIPNIAELMKDAKPSDTIKKAHKKYLEWINSEEYRQEELKRVAGVAILMNQVVGAEVL